MAKIGLKYPVYAIATDDGSTITYTGGRVLAKAISANISINLNEARLRADDSDSESDKSFSDGSVELGIDDLSSQAKIDLLGYAAGDVIDAETGEMELSTAGSNPPYVGLGFYGKGKKDGVPYWRAVWLIKVQFGEPAEEFQTQGDAVEFRTPTISGNILTASWDSTYWKEEGRFSTEAGAKAWLDGKCGLANKCAPVVSDVASGTYEDAQNVTLTCATDGAVIKYTIDGTIPSATHGLTYSEPIECAAGSNTCIKAVATKAEHANSDILELYIIVEGE